MRYTGYLKILLISAVIIVQFTSCSDRNQTPTQSSGSSYSTVSERTPTSEPEEINYYELTYEGVITDYGDSMLNTAQVLAIQIQDCVLTRLGSKNAGNALFLSDITVDDVKRFITSSFIYKGCRRYPYGSSLSYHHTTSYVFYTVDSEEAEEPVIELFSFVMPLDEVFFPVKTDDVVIYTDTSYIGDKVTVLSTAQYIDDETIEVNLIQRSMYENESTYSTRVSFKLITNRDSNHLCYTSSRRE